MWEKFTQSSKKAIKYATDAARQHRAPFVDTEHMLLGLLREEKAFAMKILRHLDVPVAKLRLTIEADQQVGEHSPDIMAFSDHAKDVLEASYKEAQRLKHSHIGTEHLLMGLALVKDGKASRYLHTFVVDYSTIRATTTAIIKEQQERAVSQSTTTSETAFRSLSEDSVAIQQILRRQLVDHLRGTEYMFRDLVDPEMLQKVRQEIRRLQLDLGALELLHQWRGAGYPGLPLVAGSQLEQDPAVHTLLLPAFCRAWQVLPLRLDADGHLVVAMADPADLWTIENIAQWTHHRVLAVRADKVELAEVLTRFYKEVPPDDVTAAEPPPEPPNPA
ncbi:MAG: Clp protease N-terminal domain-containing protein [bacterium]